MMVDRGSSTAGAIPLVNESCRRGEGRQRRCMSRRLLVLLVLKLVLEMRMVAGAMLVHHE